MRFSGLLSAKIQLPLSAVFASTLATAPANAASDDIGHGVSCAEKRCAYVRTVPTLRPGKLLTFIIEFDRTRLQPISLTIGAPTDADQAAGVKYGFATLPEVDPNKRQPREKEFSAPFTKCNEQTCYARIDDDVTIPGHGLQKDLLENMLKYDVTLFSFEAGKGVGRGGHTEADAGRL